MLKLQIALLLLFTATKAFEQIHKRQDSNSHFRCGVIVDLRKPCKESDRGCEDTVNVTKMIIPNINTRLESDYGYATYPVSCKDNHCAGAIFGDTPPFGRHVMKLLTPALAGRHSEFTAAEAVYSRIMESPLPKPTMNRVMTVRCFFSNTWNDLDDWIDDVPQGNIFRNVPAWDADLDDFNWSFGDNNHLCFANARNVEPRVPITTPLLAAHVLFPEITQSEHRFEKQLLRIKQHITVVMDDPHLPDQYRYRCTTEDIRRIHGQFCSPHHIPAHSSNEVHHNLYHLTNIDCARIFWLTVRGSQDCWAEHGQSAGSEVFWLLQPKCTGEQVTPDDWATNLHQAALRYVPNIREDTSCHYPTQEQWNHGEGCWSDEWQEKQLQQPRATADVETTSAAKYSQVGRNFLGLGGLI